MTMEKSKKYKWIHGLLKSSLTNAVTVAHATLPKELLIQSKEDVKNSPEMYNVLQAYEEAITNFNKYNCAREFKDTDSFKKMEKIKDLAITMLASDSAYYFMFEYFLKAYCEIKFKNKVPNITELFDSQADDVYKLLMDKLEAQNKP